MFALTLPRVFIFIPAVMHIINEIKTDVSEKKFQITLNHLPAYERSVWIQSCRAHTHTNSEHTKLHQQPTQM